MIGIFFDCQFDHVSASFTTMPILLKFMAPPVLATTVHHDRQHHSLCTGSTYGNSRSSRCLQSMQHWKIRSLFLIRTERYQLEVSHDHDRSYTHTTAPTSSQTTHNHCTLWRGEVVLLLRLLSSALLAACDRSFPCIGMQLIIIHPFFYSSSQMQCPKGKI